MTANTVNGSGNGARSGAQTLVLLAVPLNCLILRALAQGTKQQAELRVETGSPAQTTLRAQLKRLVEIGALTKQRRNRFPGVLEYELTTAGRDLLFVAEALESWLDQTIQSPRPLESNTAKAATQALTEGWSSTMLRALAAGPRSLTELDGVIGSLSYPSLERRLAALRLAGLVEAKPGNGRGMPYAVTAWLRRGIAPIVAAARWERRHLPSATAPIGRLDAEAAFLLAVPLVQLPSDLYGMCRMATELPKSGRRRLAGVTIEVENGKVISCATQLQAEADAWALGSPAAWLDAVIDGDVDRLELGGNGQLARAAIEALNQALFGLSAGRSPRGART